MKLQDVLEGKNVMVLIDDFERYCFFEKMLGSINVGNVFFVHSTYFSFYKAKRKTTNEFNSFLLTSERGINFDAGSSQLSIDEVKLGVRKNTNLDPKSVEYIEKILPEIDCFIVFKGFQFSYYKISEILPKGMTIFFEIGNFPDKYQWSFLGVNADADHSHKVREIKKLVSNEELDALRNLLFSFVPPHISKTIVDKALEAVINKFGSIFLKTLCPQPSFSQYLSMASNAVKSRKLLKSLSNKSCEISEEEKYCLFIGQVEFDSQTVFQSTDVGLSALKKAKSLASERNTKLIVRMHPGERNAKHLKESIDFCNLHNIEINNSGALLEVVRNAEFVMTINSTGGAHSILFGKEVINFGNAFYGGWQPNDVVKYYKYVLEDLKF